MLNEKFNMKKLMDDLSEMTTSSSISETIDGKRKAKQLTKGKGKIPAIEF